MVDGDKAFDEFTGGLQGPLSRGAFGDHLRHSSRNALPAEG